MANIGAFDATQVQPSEGRDFTPLPAGKYPAMITASDLKPTKAQTGHYLSLEFTVTEGEHQGRKVFTNLNLDNPNQQAVEIAQRDLSAICHAVGKLTVTDSAELHDIPLTINVKVRPAKGDYPASNDITKYEKAGVVAQTPAAQPAAAAPAAAPPWKRSA